MQHGITAYDRNKLESLFNKKIQFYNKFLSLENLSILIKT